MKITYGLLIGVILLTSGCTYYTTEIVDYPQVSVAPIVTYQSVGFAPAVVPTYYYGVQEPIDVTTNIVDYY
ncbi:MAG: hypothetical protein ACHP65_06835 [Legionellales bacterium]